MLSEEFNGVFGCDCFPACHKYMGNFDITVQFCIVHLIRDIKYLRLSLKSGARAGARP